jgi:hypothetical protein
MEDFPDEVICNILECLTDVRSLAHFAMASRRCREAAARADLVRECHMPVKDRHQVLHPANVQHAKQAMPKGFKHCLKCFMCRCLIPVPFGAVVVNHQCVYLTYKFPMWTNQNVALYRGPTQHLPQPLPCSAERLRVYQVPRPSVYPYAPLFA